MNTEIRVVVISAVTALITSGLVAVVDYTVREREMDIKMMEIAVGLLKEKANGPLQPARAWAVVYRFRAFLSSILRKTLGEES